MTFAALLSERVDVIHIGDIGTDRYNNPERGETSRDSDVPCRIDQLSEDELTVQRDTAGATHIAFFGLSQALGPFDRIERDSGTYEVTGPPSVVWGAVAPHHLEAHLRSLTDWTYPGSYP